MGADGQNPRRVTDHRGFAGMPVWSPDGTRLAYQWRSDAPEARWQLMLLTLADGSSRSITDGSANDQVVNWAPDGKRLIFHSDRTGQNQLYTWSEGRVTRLAETPYDDRSASWSPDGRSISFVSVRDGEGRGIYVANANSSASRRVGTIEVRHSLPFHSPDGRRLLITPSMPGGTEIWTLDVETGETERLSGCQLAQEPVTLVGEYAWNDGKPHALRAVLTPTASGGWNAEFFFKHFGKRVFSGVVHGSLSGGELNGEVDNPKESRHFRFTAHLQDGVFQGEHLEQLPKGPKPTGTLWLRIEDPGSSPPDE